MQFTSVTRPTSGRSRPRRSATGRSRCPNCLVDFELAPGRVTYCSLRCHDEAKAVRYARGVRDRYPDGPPDDVAYAVKMKIAHALSGGYDAAARRLSSEIREAVWSRDKRRCVLCGADGVEIDHIDGPSNTMGNLRLLCRDCHRSVTEAHLVPISDPVTEARFVLLWARVDSPFPLRECDVGGWAWRAWNAEHRQPSV